MIYLKVKEVKFEQTTQSDDYLHMGRFTRAELEEILENANGDVFSVYFYQNEEETAQRKVRIDIGEYPGPTSRDGDGSLLFCPPFCEP